MGLLLLFALNRTGFDLFRANAIKIVIATALAIVTVPVFVFEQQVAWLPAAFVSIGFTLGATGGRALRGTRRRIRDSPSTRSRGARTGGASAWPLLNAQSRISFGEGVEHTIELPWGAGGKGHSLQPRSGQLGPGQ